MTATTIFRYFRTLILFTVVFVLAGCPVVIQGNIRNDSGTTVSQMTDWKPFEEPIPLGESRKVQLGYEGACVELIVDGTSMFYQVPEPPPDAQISGYWNPTYSVVMRPDGLFFVSGDTMLSRFDEVDECYK